MPELVPRPIGPDLPLVALAALLPCAPAEQVLGVWLPCRWPLPIVLGRGGRRHVLLADGDLGRLLRRCSWVVIRLGSEIVAVPAGELGRVRALRIAVGLHGRGAADVLRTLFPDALQAPPAIQIPLGHRSAEEILAACAAARAPVIRSDVVYGAADIRRSG